MSDTLFELINDFNFILGLGFNIPGLDFSFSYGFIFFCRFLSLLSIRFFDIKRYDLLILLGLSVVIQRWNYFVRGENFE